MGRREWATDLLVGGGLKRPRPYSSTDFQPIFLTVKVQRAVAISIEFLMGILFATGCGKHLS